MEGSPSIAQLFEHIHFVRLVFVFKDAPEFGDPRRREWVAEPDPGRIAQRTPNDSAKAVRDAVKSRVEAGRASTLTIHHPIPLLQHMLWQHQGLRSRRKLALKVGSRPMTEYKLGHYHVGRLDAQQVSVQRVGIEQLASVQSATVPTLRMYEYAEIRETDAKGSHLAN